MEKLNIREMTAEDVDAVHEIELASFSVPWSKSLFLEVLAADANDKLYVAESGGIIAGYIDLWCVLDEATVANIAVSEEFRRQGIAAALMEYTLEAAKNSGMMSVTLEVRASNEPAIKLYEQFGFKSAGIRPNYYEKPKEDAIIMWKYFH